MHDQSRASTSFISDYYWTYSLALAKVGHCAGLLTTPARSLSTQKFLVLVLSSAESCLCLRPPEEYNHLMSPPGHPAIKVKLHSTCSE